MNIPDGLIWEDYTTHDFLIDGFGRLLDCKDPQTNPVGTVDGNTWCIYGYYATGDYLRSFILHEDTCANFLDGKKHIIEIVNKHYPKLKNRIFVLEE